MWSLSDFLFNDAEGKREGYEGGGSEGDEEEEDEDEGGEEDGELEEGREALAMRSGRSG
jgi:hypothetical protein